MRFCFFLCILVVAYSGICALEDMGDLSERSGKGDGMCVAKWGRNKNCRDKNQVHGYGYNTKKKRCEKFVGCINVTQGIFKSRKECLQSCDRTSKCLEDKYSKYHEEDAYGKAKEYFYYSADEDNCVAIDSFHKFLNTDFWTS
ncbi:hypothetical protein MTO96_034442 [Rhipicephalus appendiculatus]